MKLLDVEGLGIWLMNLFGWTKILFGKPFSLTCSHLFRIVSNSSSTKIKDVSNLYSNPWVEAVLSNFVTASLPSSNSNGPV